MSLVAAMARTVASGFGWKVVISAPVVGLSAAIRFRIWPLTLVKLPPM